VSVFRSHISSTLLYSYLKGGYPDLGDHLFTFFGSRRRIRLSPVFVIWNHVSRTLLYSYLKKGYPDLGDHLPTFFGCRRRLYWRYRRLWTLYTAMYTPGIAPPRPKSMYSALAIDLVRSDPFQCRLQRFLGDSTPIPRSSLVCFLVL
jgi:hypothetical protein